MNRSISASTPRVNRAKPGSDIEDQAAIELEIMREQAEALGNKGITLQQLIDGLNEMKSEIEELLDLFKNGLSPARSDFLKRHLEQLSEEFREWRLKALEERRKLIIQREAVGFRRHKYVYEFYPIPDEPGNPILIIDGFSLGKGEDDEGCGDCKQISN